MKQTSTMWLAAILVAALAGSSFAGTYSGGSGTPDDPYQIGTAEDIIEMSGLPEDWGKHFVMIADVDMAGYTFAEAVIGTFEGRFDGNGQEIQNLRIVSGADNLGLCYENRGTIINSHAIGSVSGGVAVGGLCVINYGTISNCHAATVVTGIDGWLGGLCAENRGGLITDSYATGPVTAVGEAEVLGGLCGFNDRRGTIRDCYSTGSVTGDYFSRGIGGLCGENMGTISNCHARGTVIAGDASDDVGGLVGFNFTFGGRATIVQCYATGDVQGDDNVGGLVGYNLGEVEESYATGDVGGGLAGGLVGANMSWWHSVATIRDCYATGDVTGNVAGGLVGQNGIEFDGDYVGCVDSLLFGEIARCYSTGRVAGDWRTIGGLVGINGYFSCRTAMGHSGDIVSCVHDAETSGSWDLCGRCRCGDWSGIPCPAIGSGYSTAEMKHQSTYSGWDFVDIWFMRDGVEYARLRALNRPPVADAGTDISVYVPKDQPAQVTLDSTSSFDPDGDALEYFWFNDAHDLIATGAEPNVVLPIGEHVLDLIANDGIADSEPDHVVVAVIGPMGAVQRLIGMVTESGLRHKRPLLATLEAALASIERDNSIAAINRLHAFQNKVLAQVPRYDADLATELIEGADAAIGALESESAGGWDTFAWLSPITSGRR